MSTIYSLLPRLLLAGAIVLGWVTSIWTAAGSALNETNVESAIQENEELRTYKNVIDLYDTAIGAHPDDISWYIRKAEAYKELNWYESYIRQCEAITRTFPKDAWGYERLMEYYVSENDYQNVFKVYQALPTELKDNEYLKSSFEQYEYEYRYLSGAYDNPDPLSWGYAVVGAQGYRGYVNESTRRVFEHGYEEAHPTLGDAAAVKEDGEWFLVDMDGDRIHASRDAIEDLYSPFEGFVLAKVDGKYGYYDENLENPTHFEYDDATSFWKGVAAVRKGDKWALIDTSFNQLTEYIFDSVVTDYSHVCSKSGLVFAKMGEAYQLYNTEGRRIGDQEFEDARMFRDDLAAVCQGGKWGFINQAGELVIPCTYEGAESFNLGLAPVAQGGLWGFVNEENEMVFEPTFSAASSLSPEGITLVDSGGSQRYIQFYKFTVEE